LADHLRRYPTSPAVLELAERKVFDALMATRRDGGGRAWWASAPPYVKRHAIQHAVDAAAVDELLADPEFLVHGDSAAMTPELDRAASHPARLAAAVYRASRPHFQDEPHMRQRILLLNAVRYRAIDLVRGLKEVASW
jgi:hypothetical protein